MIVLVGNYGNENNDEYLPRYNRYKCTIWCIHMAHLYMSIHSVEI